VADRTRSSAAVAALRAERRFVLALGGYALELPGGTLVTHERIASPRFNFAVVTGVPADRQAAFFERALDHYFQRALRPRFRVPDPAPPHVDATLRRFSYRPLSDALVVWVHGGPPTGAPSPGWEVRPAAADEVEAVASFWSEPSERPELRMALDVAVHHPSPGEQLVPTLAIRDGRPAAAALVYRTAEAAGIHLVTTQPDERGRGAATALVQHAVRDEPPEGRVPLSILTGVPRIGAHLGTIGFEAAGTFREYELPPDAELDLPPPGPPTPARWRPPR
jgi:GNAT superfamily N-acetyltransferase